MLTCITILAFIIYLIINFIILIGIDVKTMELSYNPIQVYKIYKVNWFGCIVLVLVTHVIFIIPAIVFWFYKLGTVGRKDED